MKGNIYITVPTADIRQSNYLLLLLVTIGHEIHLQRRRRSRHLQQTIVHPTWAQFGERNQGLFGSPVTVSVSDVEYIVYEMEASWLDSEVSALIALGNGLTQPSYTVYTNAEVRQFIADNAEELA